MTPVGTQARRIEHLVMESGVRPPVLDIAYELWESFLKDVIELMGDDPDEYKEWYESGQCEFMGVRFIKGEKI